VSGSVRTLFEDAFAVLSQDCSLYKGIFSKLSTTHSLRQLLLLNGDLLWLAAEVALDRCHGDVHQLSGTPVCWFDNQEVLGCLFYLLIEKVEKNSFEEFCIFAKARQLTKTAECPVLSLSHLLDNIPTCLQYLLWSDPHSRGFQLVNEFYLQPLCNVSGKVFVGEAELLWGMSVEANSCLASFQLKTAFGSTGSRLSAHNGQVCIIANRRDGSLWKIKAVDDLHVKISTDRGIFKFQP
jgi:hypothetical protein